MPGKKLCRSDIPIYSAEALLPGRNSAEAPRLAVHFALARAKESNWVEREERRDWPPARKPDSLPLFSCISWTGHEKCIRRSPRHFAIRVHDCPLLTCHRRFSDQRLTGLTLPGHLDSSVSYSGKLLSILRLTKLVGASLWDAACSSEAWGSVTTCCLEIPLGNVFRTFG